MSRFCFALVAVAIVASQCAAESWKAQPSPIVTRWAKDVSPEKVHAEYPRPQMAREKWQSLNGLWSYAIAAKDQAAPPEKYEGEILVPFPVESALSGVKKGVSPEQSLWEQRKFKLPANWKGQNVLLHFGAVDWDSTVWVDGTEVGRHIGGYDPFSYDITAALKGSGEHEVVVRSIDPSDKGSQPHGKQNLKPGGIFYTPVTGIWQSVWLEPVPKAYIESLKLTPKFEGSIAEGAASGTLVVEVNVKGGGAKHRVKVSGGGKKAFTVSGKPGKALALKINKPRLWTPDDPYLYGLKIELLNGEKLVDSVKSYCGMRKSSMAKDANGVLRMMLNDRFVFQYGFLDQGFWPEGIYTAPTDEAMRYDLEMTKKFGMNLVRKHVKVEPARWYYWCDKLGLIVWQDMPSCRPFIGKKDADLKRSAEDAKQFETEWTNVMNALRNSPAIVMWVPFNEGWGQYDTARIVELTRSIDPSRLVNAASGWTDRGAGDVNDIHEYPGPAIPPVEEKRGIVLGEFGGLGLPIEGHVWQTDKKNWGYKNLKDKSELQDGYAALIEKLAPMIEKGLSAAVYTQTTDVESEVNGLMTYDREVTKIEAAKLVEFHKGLWENSAKVKSGK